MDENISEFDEKIWRRVAETYGAYVFALRDLWSADVNRVALLKKALHSSDWWVALHSTCDTKNARLLRRAFLVS